jgi:hypothetical protein
MSDRAHPSCGTSVVGVLIALSPGRNVVTTRPLRAWIRCPAWSPLRTQNRLHFLGIRRSKTSFPPRRRGRGLWPDEILDERQTSVRHHRHQEGPHDRLLRERREAPSRSSTLSLRSLIWLASPRSDSLPAYRGPPPHSDPRRRSVRSRKGAGESFRTSGRRPRTPFRRGSCHETEEASPARRGPSPVRGSPQPEGFVSVWCRRGGGSERPDRW